MADCGGGSPELAKMALEATIRHRRWTGRKRRERRSSLSEKKTRGEGGSEVTANVVGQTGLSGGICYGFAAQ
jgi:hypothetical protein